MDNNKLSTNLASLGTDCISRQQAIDVATSATMEWDGMYVQDLNVRIREAIEQLPPVNNLEMPNSSDAISREQAIETVGWYSCHSGDKLLFADNVLRQLPPIQPKRGKWIDGVIPNDSGGLPVIVCDQCNTFFPLQFGDGHNFCPNCGADMRGEQDG